MKNFRLQIVIRLLLMLIFTTGTFYLLSETEFYITATTLLVFTALFIIELLHYIERTNRKLGQFLEAIRYADFTSSFAEHGLGKSFESLNRAFNEVLTAFNQVRRQTEEQKNYLQTIVEHVGIGILVYQKDGSIELINRWLKKTLSYNHLLSIDSLRDEHNELKSSLKNIRSTEKQMVQIHQNEETLQLSLHATEFRIEGKEMMVVSIQNIKSELDENEMKSWNKLIRVLTHEIMNSITPISTLSASSLDLLQEEGHEAKKDLGLALETIRNRSEGLLHFVEDYRSLTKIPPPKIEPFSISFLFLRLGELFKEKLNAVDFSFQDHIQKEVVSDEKLLEQVLINLLINALDALKEVDDPTLTLQAYMGDDESCVIEVLDNGPGIAHEIEDKIFVPFFTSKPKGSGIGLSVSRQILRNLGGDLKYLRKNDQTCFRLSFYS